MSISDTFSNFHSNTPEEGGQKQQLPFLTAEEEAARIEKIRHEIFKNNAGLMAICRQANVPTNIRNLISGLINLSGGERVFRANDFEIASVFYQDETKREALKKKVQRWRGALHKWQTQTGITLVQFRSGYQTTKYDGNGNWMTKNEKTEYRLVILDMAANVQAIESQDIDAAARACINHIISFEYPSRLEETRKNPLTINRCFNTSTSWIKKTLELAREDGDLEEVVRDMQAELQNLIDEFLTEDREESRTEASYQELNGETFLDTRSTIITSSFNSNYLNSNNDEFNNEIEINRYSNTSNINTEDSLKERIPSSEELNLVSSIKPKNIDDVPMVERALLLARRGFRVFPVYKMSNGACSCRYGTECPTPAKHPCILGWNNEATTNEAKIRSWWRKFRNYNIGIATGDYTDEHILVVLDVDTKADGFESLELLENEFGRLPETLTAITGSKGRHFIFWALRGLDIRNIQASQKLGKGLDIRGLGGFIVAVGSVHSSGNRYEWVDENAPVAEIPKWIVEKLTAPVVKTYGASVSVNQRNNTVPFSNFNNITIVREHEGRNNFLFVKALHLFRNGYDRPTVEKQIALINEKVCEPPVGKIEMQKLINSAEERHPSEPK